MKTINNQVDRENVFSGLFVRKRESTGAAACFACFLANGVIILCKSELKIQINAH